MTADIEDAPEPSAGDLAQIAKLAQRLRELNGDAEALQAELKAKQEAIRAIQETDLPRLMLDIGMANFDLIGGGHIELKTEYYGSIAKDRSTGCFRWLRGNGYESLIKRELKSAFGKGESPLADQLAKLMKELAPKAKFSDKESVHPSTLKAFINEQVKAGRFEEGSEEAQLFGLFIRRYAAVEFPDGVLGHNGGPPLDDEEF